LHLITGIVSLFTFCTSLTEHLTEHTFRNIPNLHLHHVTPIQAIESKVSIIVSLILHYRGSCGGLVAEDASGNVFF